LANHARSGVWPKGSKSKLKKRRNHSMSHMRHLMIVVTNNSLMLCLSHLRLVVIHQAFQICQNLSHCFQDSSSIYVLFKR
jgi:hypothetical protein